MFCQKCGTPIPDSAQFCSSCGVSIAPLTTTKPPPNDTIKRQPSKPVLICAIGILAAFFMPWVQSLFGALSGYHLANMGSSGNFLWAIPILAGTTIFFSYSGADNRAIGCFTGIVPLVALALYVMKVMYHGGSEDVTSSLQVFRVGVYLTLFFSVAIMVVADSPAAATTTNPKPKA